MQQNHYTHQSNFARKYVAEGILKALHTLLEQRFGGLPADVVDRLDKADASTLRTWTRRVFTASSLEDVFAADTTSDTGAVSALERRARFEDVLAHPFCNFARRYFGDGAQRGFGQGVQEGIEAGHRELLRAQLEQRFGKLPADAVVRLHEADTDNLAAWGRRVLTATSLDDLFAAGSRRRRRRDRGVPDFAPPWRATMGLTHYTYQSDFARKYFAQGFHEGFGQGLQEGIEPGYRALLLAQLEQCFGELPDDIVARLDEVDTYTLAAWGRRVLTATSLDDVFASGSA